MITCFTPAGYIRFAHSLIRFCDMREAEALVFINLCARANYNAHRAAPPHEQAGVIRGISWDGWEDGKPYHTEVQFYKAMQALAENMQGGLQSPLHQEAAAHLQALMNDISGQFFHAYGFDIEDTRTVYGLCESALEPEAEPAVCLLDDWNRIREGD